MTGIPPEAERHIYANSSDHMIHAPLSSRLWVELKPGEQVVYWNASGQGVARRRRARRQRLWMIALGVFILIVVGGALALANFYVQKQLG